MTVHKTDTGGSLARSFIPGAGTSGLDSTLTGSTRPIRNRVTLLSAVATTPAVLASRLHRVLIARNGDNEGRHALLRYLAAAVARCGGRAAIGTESPSRTPEAARVVASTKGPPDRERHAAAPDAAAVAPGAATGIPLLNRATIEMLGAHMPLERLSSFLRDCLREAESLHRQLQPAPPTSRDLLRRAHSLKGAAGTLGMMRISAAAGEIETAAGRGQVGPDLVELLGNAVRGTSAELQSSGPFPGLDGAPLAKTDRPADGPTPRPAETSVRVTDRRSQRAA